MCCRPPASTRGCPGRWRGEMAGTLYVVATPLGNLEDLSPRAAATLTRAGPGAAEGTPPPQPLVAPLGPRPGPLNLPPHPNAAAAPPVLPLLARGERGA